MLRKWKSYCWIWVAAVALLATASAQAAPPWAKLLSLSRVEADPEKMYDLTEENGPWMIMACSFSGETAQQQAHELVLELRDRYKLPAYMYRKEFDFGDETFGRGVDEFGEPVRMRYQRGGQSEEVAVLVGDYPAVDDPEAQKTLHRMKYYRPDCLQIEKGEATTRTLAAWRTIQKRVLAPGNAKKKKGPMGHAFVTTNPLLPREFYVPKGVDRLVVKMNKGVEHSLLDCTGKYTVQVAHFTGSVVLDQAEIEAIEGGDKEMKSGLAQAAAKAHRLTEALRMKGYEAYEFHDRYASIVTVGSFDSVGSKRPDGKIDLNPKIHAIMKNFGAAPNQTPNQAGTVEAKSLAGVPFDIQPIPVHVPKISVSAGNDQTASLLR
jgi:hypothetical protein